MTERVPANMEENSLTAFFILSKNKSLEGRSVDRLRSQRVRLANSASLFLLIDLKTALLLAVHKI